MRRLLVVYATAVVAALLVALLVPLGLLAGSLAHDRAVDGARQQAQGLTVFASDATRAQLRDVLDAANAGPRQVTVFPPRGSAIGAAMARTPSVELAQQGRAFTAEVDGGVEVLLPVAGARGVAVIRTFVPDSLLTDGVHAAWVTLAGLGIVLLGLAILVGDRIATRLSCSVQQLAEVAERVGSGDLDATVTPAGPREVASVGRVLNKLGDRISRMLADERELGADLSHRLRTPVTALRLDVDGLQDERERARLSEHVDHLVEAIDEAVLTARHPAPSGRAGSCDAVAVVTERARFWRVLADDTGRVLQLDVPVGSLRVPVSADELGAALDALIDNVFSHTPPGTTFAISVGTPIPHTVEVTVEDDGPGLADTTMADRGRSGTGSTGIGLDVARRTAVQAGGAIGLERSTGGGARIVLNLPAAPLSES